MYFNRFAVGNILYTLFMLDNEIRVGRHKFLHYEEKDGREYLVFTDANSGAVIREDDISTAYNESVISYMTNEVLQKEMSVALKTHKHYIKRLNIDRLWSKYYKIWLKIRNKDVHERNRHMVDIYVPPEETVTGRSNNNIQN